MIHIINLSFFFFFLPYHVLLFSLHFFLLFINGNVLEDVQCTF